MSAASASAAAAAAAAAASPAAAAASPAAAAAFPAAAAASPAASPDAAAASPAASPDAAAASPAASPDAAAASSTVSFAGKSYFIKSPMDMLAQLRKHLKPDASIIAYVSPTGEIADSFAQITKRTQQDHPTPCEPDDDDFPTPCEPDDDDFPTQPSNTERILHMLFGEKKISMNQMDMRGFEHTLDAFEANIPCGQLQTMYERALEHAQETAMRRVHHEIQQQPTRHQTNLHQWTGLGGLGSLTVVNMSEHTRAFTDATTVQVYEHTLPYPLPGHFYMNGQREPLTEFHQYARKIIAFVHREIAMSPTGEVDMARLDALSEEDARAELLSTRDPRIFDILYQRLQYAQWNSDDGNPLLKIAGFVNDAGFSCASGPVYVMATCADCISAGFLHSMILSMPQIVELDVSGVVPDMCLWSHGLHTLTVKSRIHTRIQFAPNSVRHMVAMNLTGCRIKFPNVFVAPFLRSIVMDECVVEALEDSYVMVPSLQHIATKDATQASMRNYQGFIVQLLIASSVKVAQVHDELVMLAGRTDLMKPYWDMETLQFISIPVVPSVCRQVTAEHDSNTMKKLMTTESPHVYRMRLNNVGTAHNMTKKNLLDGLHLHDHLDPEIASSLDNYERNRARVMKNDDTFIMRESFRRLAMWKRMQGMFTHVFSCKDKLGALCEELGIDVDDGARDAMTSPDGMDRIRATMASELKMSMEASSRLVDMLLSDIDGRDPLTFIIEAYSIFLSDVMRSVQIPKELSLQGPAVAMASAFGLSAQGLQDCVESRFSKDSLTAVFRPIMDRVMGPR
jgi:hypothetical protein